MNPKIEKLFELQSRYQELMLEYFNYRASNGKKYEKNNYKEAYRLRKWVAAEKKLKEYKESLDEATLKEVELLMENK